MIWATATITAPAIRLEEHGRAPAELPSWPNTAPTSNPLAPQSASSKLAAAWKSTFFASVKTDLAQVR